MDLEMQSLAAVDVRQTLCRRRGREGRFDLVATSEHQICSKTGEHCPLEFRGAEGPRSLQVPIKALIDLEGCSPLEPLEQNVAPIGYGRAEGETVSQHRF